MTRTEFEAQLPEVRKQMMGWARACMRDDDVDDLVQEALLRVLGTLDRIETDDAAPWAFGILRNVMRSEWRRQGRSREVSLVNDEGEAFDVPVAAGQEAWCEAQEALRVIASLPAERQLLFVEVVLLGNSPAEAAEARGIAVGTVKSRINRTRDEVRDPATGRLLPRLRAA